MINTNITIGLIAGSIIGLIIYLIAIDNPKSYIAEREIVCIEGYNYIYIKSGYKLAITPLIKDNNFVECNDE